MTIKNSWSHNFDTDFKIESALKCRPEQLKTIRRITQPLVKHWLVKKGQTNSKQPCSLFPKARKNPFYRVKKLEFLCERSLESGKRKNLWRHFFACFEKTWIVFQRKIFGYDLSEFKKFDFFEKIFRLSGF